MKLKFETEIVQIDDESIAVPVGDEAAEFRGVLKVNESAAFILKLLAEDTTEEAIVDAILEEYAGDRDQIAGYVHKYLNTLQAENLLV